jgi:hypothetical protein
MKAAAACFAAWTLAALGPFAGPPSPTFAVFSAQHVDDTRVTFVPPGIDWERAAPPELGRLSSSAPDDRMTARLRDHMDDFGNAVLPYEVAIPGDMRMRPYVLIDAAGATRLRVEELRGSARVAMTDPIRRDVTFFGDAVARPVSAPRRVGGGFVISGVPDRDFTTAESHRQAADLLDAKSLEAVRAPRFWAIVKQYELRIAGDPSTYVFVQWAPDDEVREAGCQYRFTLFRLTPGSTVVASSDYGCDV